MPIAFEVTSLSLSKAGLFLVYSVVYRVTVFTFGLGRDAIAQFRPHDHFFFPRSDDERLDSHIQRAATRPTHMYDFESYF